MLAEKYQYLGLSCRELHRHRHGVILPYFSALRVRGGIPWSPRMPIARSAADAVHIGYGQGQDHISPARPTDKDGFRWDP